MEDPKRVSRLLGRSLGVNKNIQKLFLSFRKNLTDQDLLYLADSLKRLKSLQRIALKVDRCKVADFGLFSLMKGLTRLSSPKSFSLSLDSLFVSNVGLNYTRKSLKKMAFLKYIHISFDNFLQVVDEGVFKVNGSLNRLTKLEDVALKIFESPQITDVILANLKLKKLVFFLRKISIFFADCSQVTDRIMYFMTQGLKKLRNLQSFKLKFWKCPGLSDVSLHYLWEMMNDLKCLASVQKFCLEFRCCPKITDAGLAYLCKALDRAISLQSLSIAFPDFSGITYLSVKRVIDCLKKSGSFAICWSRFFAE